MPSMSAARIIEITKIGVAAPGLRPVASAALEPRSPIPIPPPKAASATANAFVNMSICSLVVGVFGNSHGHAMVKKLKGLVVRFLAVITDQLEENGAKQSENERLDETNEQLHEVKWQGRHPGSVRP